jgi:hypothetical protein
MRCHLLALGKCALIDVYFDQSVAQLVGMGIEMSRVNQRLRESIDVLEMMQDPKTLKKRRRTPYEGVPKSFTTEEMLPAAKCRRLSNVRSAC